MAHKNNTISIQVDLDQLHLIGSQDLHLVCRLEDKFLPSVPPLRVIVPRDYPRTAPFCDSQQTDYGENQTQISSVLRLVHILVKKLIKMLVYLVFLLVF